MGAIPYDYGRLGYGVGLYATGIPDPDAEPPPVEPPEEPPPPPPHPAIAQTRSGPVAGTVRTGTTP